MSGTRNSTMLKRGQRAVVTQARAVNTTTLDACNGRTQPDGTYGYHVTTNFPYIIGCFTGTATLPKCRAGAPIPPMGEPGKP